MGILDNPPHVATAKLRSIQYGSGGLGDTVEGEASTLFTDRACWRQNARDAEIVEFAKQGITVTDRFYFFDSDPGLSEEHYLEDVRNADAEAGTGDGEYEIRSRAEPDASAGLGVVWRVYAERTTTGSTHRVT